MADSLNCVVYLLMKTPQKLDGCPTSGAHFRVSATYLLTDPALSGASPLPHLDLHRSEISIGQVDLGLVLLCLLLSWRRPELCLVYSVKCGRGLARDEGVSVTYLLTDPALSGASPLPHLDLHRSEISIGQVDLILLLLWLCSGF